MKYVVTDKDVYWACKIGRITRDEPSHAEQVKMRQVLEWFAKEKEDKTLGEPVAVPDGWQIVPKHPTDEMLHAGSGFECLNDTWEEMLSAAHHHPTTEKGCE